ncbi:MAG: DUF2442 domain-containing protein [Spirosomataceae bacterium]
MLHYIQKILEVQDYTVLCLFNTGEVRRVDLSETVKKYFRINDGLVSQLNDKNYFKTVKLDSYGTLLWENGVDFDPDNLYKMSLPVLQSA